MQPKATLSAPPVKEAHPVQPAECVQAAIAATYPPDVTPLPDDYSHLPDADQARAVIAAHDVDRANWKSLRATALRCAVPHG